MGITLSTYRFLIARRLAQFSIMGLFVGANYWGWSVMKGNLSAAKVFDTVPLTDPYAFLQMLCAGFVLSADILVGAFIVLLLYGLFTGRMFCSWVCPMNMVSDSSRSIRKKLKIETQLKIPRQSRYWVLLLGLILSLILGFAAFEAVSPISILHRGIIYGVGAGWLVVLAVFLFDMVILSDGWCGHLCPLGAFYGTVGRYALIKVRHKEKKCTRCMKCFDACPEVQVLDIIGKKDGIIKSSECTNCARCIEVCDDKALKFSIRNLTELKQNNIAMNKLLCLLGGLFILVSCGKNEHEMVDEDKLGIITADVKSEETNFKIKAQYSDAAPGSAETFDRAFENAPPMIPHTTEGFLPIKIENNICFTCHMPEVAESVGAISLPKTHFTDLRPQMIEVNGVLQFEDETNISIEDLDEVSYSYFNCSQCHAPQADVTIDIENKFTPEFREEFGLEKSSLRSKLEEGI